MALGPATKVNYRIKKPSKFGTGETDLWALLDSLGKPEGAPPAQPTPPAPAQEDTPKWQYDLNAGYPASPTSSAAAPPPVGAAPRPPAEKNPSQIIAEEFANFLRSGGMNSPRRTNATANVPQDLTPTTRTSDADWRKYGSGLEYDKETGMVTKGGVPIGKPGERVKTGAGWHTIMTSSSGPRLVASPMGADEALSRYFGAEWNNKADGSKYDSFQEKVAARKQLMTSDVRRTVEGLGGRPDAWSADREADKFQMPGGITARRTTDGYTVSPEDNQQAQKWAKQRAALDSRINAESGQTPGTYDEFGRRYKYQGLQEKKDYVNKVRNSNTLLTASGALPGVNPVNDMAAVLQRLLNPSTFGA